MIHLTLRGPATFGSDSDAVEAWEIPDGRAKVWFDAKGRVCRLDLAQATLDVELTPGVPSNPIIGRLIEEHGGDPEQWRASALDDPPVQPRPRGRPSGMTWPTLALALSVFFEVERLRYRQVHDPFQQVARNRSKTDRRIRQLYITGRRSIPG